MTDGLAAAPREAVAPAGTKSLWRAAFPLLVLLLVVAAIRASGVLAGFDVQALHSALGRFAVVAQPLFVLAFAAGVLFHVPGSIFVAAAVLAFGCPTALWLSFAGGFIGNVASFGVVRCTCGDGAAFRRHLAAPRIAAAIDSLQKRVCRRPLLFAGLVRLMFPTTALANYALAALGVSWRPFVFATAVGVWPQLLVTVGAFGWLWAP